MKPETFISFEEFYKPSKQAKIEDKKVEDILTDVREILNTFNGGENY